MEQHLPLHVTNISILKILINRSYTLFHSIAIALLIHYRASFFFSDTKKHIFPWLLIFSGELFLSFMWLLGRAYRWRPISRTAFPERLPEDDKLPPIDVFVCTADPVKEPTVEVMNTVMSAMALDYPPEKLHVYLQDDGGSAVTLYCMREVFEFGKVWIPFCRKYGIEIRSPGAYFAVEDDDDDCYSSNPEFLADLKTVKGEYELFKETISKARENGVQSIGNPREHPSTIEVINRKSKKTDQVKMPLLVYVSREKRPSHPHHFKAGALNVLIRVSGLISNSPYILVLDCDMYCNGPSSAKQAMCFHLDPTLSHNLAFVQFPQRFRNISQHDIYDSRLRGTFFTLWYGMDGLMGPCLSGTGFYIKRESLFGEPTRSKDIDLIQLKESLGLSNEFINSMTGNNKPNVMDDEEYPLLLKETQHLASCAYEDHTKWGEDVGFLYGSVVEDYFTGFKSLFCKGWKAVYYDPPKAQFLGNGVTTLNDMLVQGTRWSSGLAEVAISKFCPLIYGPMHNMSILGSMCFTELAIFPFYCFPLWIFATIPQLCLVLGIPLYPQASNSFILVFMFILVSSLMSHLYEAVLTGFSTREWINEHRIWVIRAITYNLYGTVDAILKKFGIREASFLPTNKNDDEEQVKLYQMGKFDFRTSTLLLTPLVTPVILNIVTLVGGVARTVIMNDWDNMFGQICVGFYVAILSYPVIEGMVLRKDKGRIPPYVSVLSSIFVVIFLCFGSVVFMC